MHQESDTVIQFSNVYTTDMIIHVINNNTKIILFSFQLKK